MLRPLQQFCGLQRSVLHDKACISKPFSSITQDDIPSITSTCISTNQPLSAPRIHGTSTACTCSLTYSNTAPLPGAPSITPSTPTRGKCSAAANFASAAGPIATRRVAASSGCARDAAQQRSGSGAYRGSGALVLGCLGRRMREMCGRGLGGRDVLA